MTGQGQVALLLVLGFMAGAINTGTNLLFALLGFMASLMVLEARRTWRGLQGVEVERELPRSVVRGEPVAVGVRLSVVGGGRRGLPFLVEELDPRQALDREARALVWSVEGAQGAAWEAAFTRRGRVDLGPLRITSQGPCGLVAARRELWPASREVLVLPRLRRLREAALLASSAPPAERRPRAFGAERRDVVRSLRELRAGDDPRTIHWRASARRGGLVVREFERTGPEGALVLLDLAAPRGQDQAEAEATLEAAVELALALVDELGRRGEPAGLGLVGEGPPVLQLPTGPGGVARAREALALARPVAAPDLRQLLRLARRGGRDLRLLLVTTRAARAARAAAGAATLDRVVEVPDAAQAESWLAPDPIAPPPTTGPEAEDA